MPFQAQGTGNKCNGLPTRRWLLAIAAVVLGSFPAGAHAEHACDALGDRGWSTVPTVETVAQKDGAPYKADPTGSWYVDRTVTLLPFCNYYNNVGNYSLRSYSLSPEDHKERIEICRAGADGNPIAVAPYTGRCPPG